MDLLLPSAHASRRPLPPPPWPLLAGLVASLLDLGIAVAFWAGEGVAPLRVLQSIARWVLGAGALSGGLASAGFGLLFYTLLMWGLARLYLAAARRFPVLVRRPLRCGLLYGLLMYALVFHVAVPLFAVDGGTPPGRLDWILACVLAYMTVVGLPCAWAARRVMSR